MSERTLRLDYETRSTVDLTKAGVHTYAECADTDAWCACYAVDDGPIEEWRIGQPCPELLIRAATEPRWLVRAWNCAFEIGIWNGVMAPRHGWPVLPLDRCRCTMAEALALALPGKLEIAAGAVNLDIRKDMVGNALMKRMMRPRRFDEAGHPVWWDEAEKLDRLVAYCRTDVEVEREIGRRILPLSAAEQRMWELDQVINGRGIAIDVLVVGQALAVIEAAKVRLDTRMAVVTLGEVTRASKVKDLTAWVGERLGFDVTSLAKADIVDLLDRPSLPADVREALEIRRDAAKASTAKLKAMRASVSADGRARGLHQYHGANTGRWAGRRVQAQNMPRPNMDQSDIDSVLELLAQG